MREYAYIYVYMCVCVYIYIYIYIYIYERLCRYIYRYPYLHKSLHIMDSLFKVSRSLENAYIEVVFINI